MDSKAGIVATANGRLNVRSGPSTGAAAVTALNKGSYVTLISKSGSWWQVEYAKGKFGYCHSDYITQTAGTPMTVATRSTSLNVRGGPGTNYARTGSAAKGETVIVLSTASGWSRILYQGTKTGYVSAQYLSGSAYDAVALSVPSFKQTDSRWAEVQIGQSGKTMAQIGCATTAIAMMESARTGSTVYPDAMAAQLHYTPDGSVYWPAHYTAVTEGSGYLSRVYSLLKAGKPVLFGARNVYGKQHWVVITGYTGGATLTASGFTVHDPGSSSRTNLQLFLNEYPTFYKYFYA
ncbi:MAG: SH3 domain-containing protein [Oscillospiraceae bacterium]|nr:SH3 domain-containing protein [Oscillospiraceae bacterium]